MAQWRIWAAGCLVGAAVGLKPTVAIYGLGLALALPALPGSSWWTRILRLPALALSGFVGAAATGGLWAWRIHELTGNPIFPYLNQIFRSPLLPAHSFEYRRFLSSKTLFYGDPSILDLELRVLESLGREDFRYALFFVLLCLALLLRVVAKRSASPSWMDPDKGVFLSLFFCGSFLVWLKIFAIPRYLLAISLLSPLLAFFWMQRMVSSSRLRAAALASFMVLLAAGLELSNLERVPWSSNPFEVDLSGMSPEQESMVLMIDQAPTSYVIPEFPSDTRFVRPRGNLDLEKWNPLYRFIEKTLREHPGPIFALYEENPEDRDMRMATLTNFALSQDEGRCIKLRDRRILDRLVLCAVLRRAPVENRHYAEDGVLP